MRIIIPFAGSQPKTRLSDMLSLSERRVFAKAMLQDVLTAVRNAGHDPIVLTPSPLDNDVPTIVDDRSLSEAVNAVLDDDALPVAIVMADMALLTASALTRLTETLGDVVLAPGLGGGTNALVVRDSAFSVDYHGTSYLDHRAIAQDAGLSVSEVDSWRLAVDIDEPSDLVEVLLHTDGHACEWLITNGFSLADFTGRTDATRGSSTQPQVLD